MMYTGSIPLRVDENAVGSMDERKTKSMTTGFCWQDFCVSPSVRYRDSEKVTEIGWSVLTESDCSAICNDVLAEKSLA